MLRPALSPALPFPSHGRLPIAFLTPLPLKNLIHSFFVTDDANAPRNCAAYCPRWYHDLALSRPHLPAFLHPSDCDEMCSFCSDSLVESGSYRFSLHAGGFRFLSCRAVTSLQQTEQLRFSPFTGKPLTYPLFPISLSHTFSSAKRNFIFLFSAKPLNSNLLDLALFTSEICGQAHPKILLRISQYAGIPYHGEVPCRRRHLAHHLEPAVNTNVATESSSESPSPSKLVTGTISFRTT